MQLLKAEVCDASQYFNGHKINACILKLPMGKLLFNHDIQVEIFFNFKFLERKSLNTLP